MVEFAVTLSALSLLLIGTITIAGYQQAQRRTVIAARHAAFDAMWVGSRARTQPILQRLFVDHFDDPALTDATGKERIVTQSGVTAQASKTDVPGQAAIATSFLLTPLKVASGFFGGGFDLSSSGYELVTLQTRINQLPHLPEPFGSLDLTLTQTGALVGDAWNSANSSQVRARTAGLVPTQGLSQLSSIWRVLATPLAILEPGLDRLCLGLIEPEGVPNDRLGPIENSLRRRSPC